MVNIMRLIVVITAIAAASTAAASVPHGLYLCEASATDQSIGRCFVRDSNVTNSELDFAQPMFGPSNLYQQFAMWYVAPVTSGNKTYEYRISQYLGISATTASVTSMQSSLALGLPERGELSTNETTPLLFHTNITCQEDIVVEVVWTVAIIEKDTNIIADIVQVAFPWRCAEPGCPVGCGAFPSGTCDYYEGVCVCADHWSGESCTVRFELKNETVCPGDPVAAMIFVVGPLTGEEWFEFTCGSDETEYEWAYMATWTHEYPNSLTAGDPYFNGTYEATDFYGPGDYTFTSFDSDFNNLVATFHFKVLSYEECGISAGTFHSGICSTDDRGVAVATTADDGSNVTACSCAVSTYWYDCSRGCSPMTNVTERGMRISNDPLVDTDDMHYIQKSTCIWSVHPEPGGWEVIDISFEFMDIDPSDTLTLTPDGSTDTETLTFTGNELPLATSISTTGFELVLQSDYSNARRGFILNYNTRALPLPVGAVVGIVVAAAICAVAVTIVSSFVIIKISARRRAAKAARASMPEEEWNKCEEEYIVGNPMVESAAIEELVQHGVSVAPTVLSFGAIGSSGSSGCPINVRVGDTFTITNLRRSSVKYRVRVNQDPGHYNCQVRPGSGVISSGRSQECSIAFIMECTCAVNVKLAIEVIGAGEKWPIVGGTKKQKQCDDASAAECDDVVELMSSTQAGIPPTLSIGAAYVTLSLVGAKSKRLDSRAVTSGNTIERDTRGDVLIGRYAEALVAIKEFNVSSHEKYARLYECVRHPNIVEFIGACYTSDRRCVVTELVRYGSVDRIYGAMNVPFGLQIQFARDIAKGISYLNNAGVICRTLCPTNCMVTSLRRGAPVCVKLVLPTDSVYDAGSNNKALFSRGTSTFLVSQQQQQFQSGPSGRSYATPFIHSVNSVPQMDETLNKWCVYSAPEVLTEAAYDTSADVYSLGMILWSIYNRSAPWPEAGSQVAQFNAKMGRRPLLNASAGLSAADKLDEEQMTQRQQYMDIIADCWDQNARNRVVATVVIERIDSLVCSNEGFERVDEGTTAASSALFVTATLQTMTATSPTATNTVTTFDQ